MKITHLFIYKVLCFLFCLSLIGKLRLIAQPGGFDKKGYKGLENPLLVKRFYELNNGILFWAAAQGDMKKELLVLISNAGYLGLDKGKYHAAQVDKIINNAVVDSLKLWEQDKTCTDAFISFCKDIYEGYETTRLVSYDELSSKQSTTDNERILEMIKLAATPSDLDIIVKKLEPDNNQYQTLKTELKTQIALKSNDKVKQLNNALNLYRWTRHFKFDNFILINIGSTILSYYNHDTVQLSSKVIVGKPSTKTPRFAAHCDKVIFYPYWNVPHDIAVKELLPKFKRSPAAVDAMGIQVIDGNGKALNPYAIKWSQYSRGNFPYLIRQSTGCDNSLGVIKFNLSDPFSVYLHDTNAKKLFASKRRYFSHGCIRIEKAIELGNYILGDKIDDAYLAKCLKDQKPVETALEKPIPVFVIYSTVELDEQGVVQYNKDIYGLLK